MKATKKQNDILYKYVIDCIDSTGYGIETKTDKEKIKFLLNTFWSEKVQHHNTRVMNYQYLFTDWLQGLPSCFNIDFENYKILELLKQWEVLPIGANEAIEDRYLANWWAKIYMAVSKAARKNKIDMYEAISKPKQLQTV